MLAVLARFKYDYSGHLVAYRRPLSSVRYLFFTGDGFSLPVHTIRARFPRQEGPSC